jgi:hypothetical protein
MAIGRNRLFLRACFLTALSTDCTLGRTVFTARCDIPWAPMLKNPNGRCHLKKWIYTQTAPLTPSGSEFRFQGSALTQHRCLLLLPPASVDAIAAPLPSPPPSPLLSLCRCHCCVAIAAPPPLLLQSQVGGS